MTEQKKRRIGLVVLALYVALPLFLFGVNWRFRVVLFPPGLPAPWPIPVPIVVPQTTT